MQTSIKKAKLKKLNITLPEDVVNILKNNLSEREVSNFISEAVKSKVRELDKDKLKAELTEGYKSTRKENNKLNKEFEGTLSDGLDEY